MLPSYRTTAKESARRNKALYADGNKNAFHFMSAKYRPDWIGALKLSPIYGPLSMRQVQKVF